MQPSDAINPMVEEDAVSFESSDMHTIADELLATPSNSIASAVFESLDAQSGADESSREKITSIDESTASEPGRFTIELNMYHPKQVEIFHTIFF